MRAERHAGTVTTGRSSSEDVLDLGFEVRRTGGVGARSIEPDSFLRRGVQDGPVRPHAVAALDRCHEVLEGVTKRRDLHPMLILG